MATEEDRRGKRQQDAPPTPEDVLYKARRIWSRDPNKARATTSEDTEFRGHFGCGLMVFLTLWNLLVTTDLLPAGGIIKHLLWTLLFMKVYGSQKVLCSLCGGVDVETFRKWTWLFIAAVSDLESLVVRKHSSSACHHIALSLIYAFACFFRSYLRIDSS